MALFRQQVRWGWGMEKTKRIIPAVCGAAGLALGCVLAYFAFAFLWTRLFVNPADVTARDADTVFTLSIMVGIFTGWLALQVSARRFWNPQNAALRRHVS